MGISLARVLLAVFVGLSPIAPIICDTFCSQPVHQSAATHCALHDTGSSDDDTVEAVTPDCDTLHAVVPATQTASPDNGRADLVSRVPHHDLIAPMRATSTRSALDSPPRTIPLLSRRI